MGTYEAVRARFIALERNLPDGVRDLGYGTWRVVKRVGQRLPDRGRPQPVTVSAYCVYRAKNAAHVRDFVDGLPPGSVAHLHALDAADPGLAGLTRSAGPGARMPLLQALIDGYPPRGGDYTMVFDDDVSFLRDGLRAFPGLAARAGLDVAQPAHAVGSLKTYRVNAFAPLSTARLVRYVEVGPVVLFSPRAIPHVLPFPPWARMGWGVDVLWTQLPALGLRLGVVDATPVLHVGPVGVAYDYTDESGRLARALTEVGASSIDDLARGLGQVWRPWRSRPPWPTTHGGRLPLRVVVLDHTAELGGAELALTRLLAAVDPAQATVRTVLFADGPLRARLEGEGHRVDLVPLDPRLAGAGRHHVGGSVMTALRSALGVSPFVVRLARHLRTLDAHLVHTTSLKADLIGTPAAWLARRPVVWHVHDRIAEDYLPLPAVRILRWAARWAPRHVIANSRATAATLPGVRRLTIAYPGLAPTQIAEDPDRRAEPEPHAVGIVGRISPTKGHLEFVRAAAIVHAARPDVQFRVIGAPLFGQDAYAAKVRAEVDALGLTDRMEFTGFVEKPAREVDRLSVCVHASGTPEPFGQVVAEAMARGVPVVATSGGGVDEIVAPPGPRPAGTEPLGWLVPPHDVDALAGAVLEALEDPVTARRRARAAWESVRERFTIERTAETVTRVWLSAVRGR